MGIMQLCLTLQQTLISLMNHHNQKRTKQLSTLYPEPQAHTSFCPSEALGPELLLSRLELLHSPVKTVHSFLSELLWTDGQTGRQQVLGPAATKPEKTAGKGRNPLLHSDGEAAFWGPQPRESIGEARSLRIHHSQGISYQMQERQMLNCEESKPVVLKLWLTGHILYLFSLCFFTSK